MEEQSNNRAPKESKLLIAALIGSAALTCLPMVNMTAENLRDNFYYSKWVKEGTAEQRKAYWEVQDHDAGTLLIPFSFLFQNRYEPFN